MQLEESRVGYPLLAMPKCAQGFLINLLHPGNCIFVPPFQSELLKQSNQESIEYSQITNRRRASAYEMQCVFCRRLASIAFEEKLAIEPRLAAHACHRISTSCYETKWADKATKPAKDRSLHHHLTSNRVYHILGYI